MPSESDFSLSPADKMLHSAIHIVIRSYVFSQALCAYIFGMIDRSIRTCAAHGDAELRPRSVPRAEDSGDLTATGTAMGTLKNIFRGATLGGGAAAGSPLPGVAEVPHAVPVSTPAPVGGAWGAVPGPPLPPPVAIAGSGGRGASAAAAAAAGGGPLLPPQQQPGPARHKRGTRQVAHCPSKVRRDRLACE